MVVEAGIMDAASVVHVLAVIQEWVCVTDSTEEISVVDRVSEI